MAEDVKQASVQQMSLEDSTFGVLFTLQKEQNGSEGIKGKLTVVAKFTVEFVQLFLFVLAGPSYAFCVTSFAQVGEWGWNLSFDTVFWKWFNYFQAENPMTNKPTGSYQLWLVFFYILTAVLCISLGLCVFVASCFKSGSFPVVWPVKLLRAIVSIIFSVLFVSSLDVFLVGIACIPDPVHPERGCVLYNFVDVPFLSASHIVHGIVAALMSITIISISFLISVADSEQNILSKELMASFDSSYCMRRFMCCTVLTLASNFLVGYLKLLSVILFIFFFIMFYDSLRLPPYYHDAANLMNNAAGSLLAWSSLLLVVKMYTSGPTPQSLLFDFGDPPVKESPLNLNSTNVTRAPPPNFASASALGAPPAPASNRIDNSVLLTNVGFYGAGGVAILAMVATKVVLWRSRRFFDLAIAKVKAMESAGGERVRVQASAVADELADYVRFDSIAAVELAIRPLRSELWREDATQETKARAVLAAEALALLGIRQFGAGKRSALIFVLYGCFLIEVLGNHIKGYAFLDRARGMRLTMRMRFMLFARDRERTHRAQGDSVGSGAMDLVSYVEFQSSFTQLVRYHRAALRATRSFWRLLVSPTISFYALSGAFKEMDETEAQAEMTYRAVLKRYPRSVKLLRAYAAFLEEVRNNPWSARKFREDADKLEETLAEGEEDKGVNQVNDATDAVVVIDSSGIITVVNQCFLKVFGFRKQEDIVGKNVGILCPPPHDKLHTTYIDSYMRTGESRILGVRQQVEARNAQGQKASILLLVSKIETNGETSFMGIASLSDSAEDFVDVTAQDSVDSDDAPLLHFTSAKPGVGAGGEGAPVRASVHSVAVAAVTPPDRLGLSREAVGRPGPVMEAVGGTSATPSLVHRPQQPLRGEIPADVAARARSGGCVFFADAAPPPPPHPVRAGADGGTCPFLQSRSVPRDGAAASAEGASAGGAERVDAHGALFRPPAKVEAAIALRRLQTGWQAPPAASLDSAASGAGGQGLLRQRGRSDYEPAAAAVAAARTLAARSDPAWDALFAGFHHMFSPAGVTESGPASVAQLTENSAADTLASAQRDNVADPAAPMPAQPAKSELQRPQAVTEAFDGQIRAASGPSGDWDHLLSTAAGSGLGRTGDTIKISRGSSQGMPMPSQRSGPAGGHWKQGPGAPTTAAAAAAIVAAKMQSRKSSTSFARVGSTLNYGGGEAAFSRMLTAVPPPMTPRAGPQALTTTNQVESLRQQVEQDEELTDAQASYKARVRRIGFATQLRMSDRDAQHATEFQRARRYRQLQKLLMSLQMRKSVVLLMERTRYLLALLVLAYVGGFILMQVQFTSYGESLQRVKMVGLLTERVLAAAEEVTTMTALQAVPPVNLSTTFEEAQERLLAIAYHMKSLEHGLYLGFGSTREYPVDTVHSAIASPTVNETQWVVPGRVPFGGRPTWKLVTPWKAMRRYEMHARVLGTPFETDVVFADSPTRAYMGTQRDTEYILTNHESIYASLKAIQELDNAAQRGALNTSQITAISIMAAMVFLSLSSLLYFRHLLEEVAKSRIVLFQARLFVMVVFLIIPTEIVSKLGSKSLRTAAIDADEQGDAEDDSEDAWDPQQAAAGNDVQTGLGSDFLGAVGATYAVGAVNKLGRVVTRVMFVQRLGRRFSNRVSEFLERRMLRLNSGMTFHRSGSISSMTSAVKISTKDDRVLDSAGAAADSYAFLGPLMTLAVLAVCSFGISYSQLQGSVDTMINIDASNVAAMLATRVHLYATQTVVAASTDASDAVVASLQNELRKAAQDLLSQHAALQTGKVTPGFRGNAIGQDLPARKRLMFQEGCLRVDKETCPATDDPIWSRVHHGLNSLVRYYVQVALLLSQDSRAVLNVDNERFQFIWRAGPADIHDGLAKSTDLYYIEALQAPRGAQALQIAVLPLVFIGSILFIQRYFGPWVKRTLHESKLMAQLPKELNVEQMLMEAMGVEGAKQAMPDKINTEGGNSNRGGVRRRKSQEASVRDSQNSKRILANRGSLNSVVPLNNLDAAALSSPRRRNSTMGMSPHAPASRVSFAQGNGGKMFF